MASNAKCNTAERVSYVASNQPKLTDVEGHGLGLQQLGSPVLSDVRKKSCAGAKVPNSFSVRIFESRP